MNAEITRTSFCAALAFLLSTSAATAAESVFPDSVFPGGRPSDAPGWELGTLFRSELPGKVTAVRVYSITDAAASPNVGQTFYRIRQIP